MPPALRTKYAFMRPSRYSVQCHCNTLYEVRLECGHEIYAPSSREASDTPRMIEHPVPVYMLTRSLLAEPLNAIPTPLAGWFVTLLGALSVGDLTEGTAVFWVPVEEYSNGDDPHHANV
jgi:hypothetical protein